MSEDDDNLDEILDEIMSPEDLRPEPLPYRDANEADIEALDEIYAQDEQDPYMTPNDEQMFEMGVLPYRRKIGLKGGPS